MDYYSRLGPIDPQSRNTRGRSVPALGYLKRWEQLVEKSNNGTLSLAEAQLMIDGFDQAELYQYEQAQELSVTLLRVGFNIIFCPLWGVRRVEMACRRLSGNRDSR